MENEKDRLVEKYIEGDLSGADARAVERAAENDSELASLLDAERVVRGTVRKDLRAIPAGATEPSARLLSMLEGSAGTLAGAGVPAAAPVAVGGVAKMMTIAAGVIGVAVGAFLIAPLFDREEAAPVPAVRVDTVIERLPAPVGGAAAPDTFAGESHAAPKPASPAGAATRPEPAGGIDRSTKSAAADRKIEQPARPEVGKPEPQRKVERLVEENGSEPVVFSTDSVRARVNVGPKRRD